MTKYRSYPHNVKKNIAKTGNINLYSELKIPRGTALHWIKTAKKISINTEKKQACRKSSSLEARFKLVNALKKEIYLIVHSKKISSQVQKKFLMKLKKQEKL